MVLSANISAMSDAADVSFSVENPPMPVSSSGLGDKPYPEATGRVAGLQNEAGSSEASQATTLTQPPLRASGKAAGCRWLIPNMEQAR
ncbi:hypothetical protein ACVMAJ_001427 [Bradyrhizobium sp. USDA 4448]